MTKNKAKSYIEYSFGDDYGPWLRIEELVLQYVVETDGHLTVRCQYKNDSPDTPKAFDVTKWLEGLKAGNIHWFRVHAGPDRFDGTQYVQGYLSESKRQLFANGEFALTLQSKEIQNRSSAKPPAEKPPAKTLTANQAMCELLLSNPEEALAMTVSDWAKKIKFARSTIASTECWKKMNDMKLAVVSENSRDRGRKTKKAEMYDRSNDSRK